MTHLISDCSRRTRPLVEALGARTVGPDERARMFPSIIEVLQSDRRTVGRLIQAAQHAPIPEGLRGSILTEARRQADRLDEIEGAICAALVEPERTGRGAGLTLRDAAAPVLLLTPAPILARLVDWREAAGEPSSLAAGVTVPLGAVKRLGGALAAHDWEYCRPGVRSGCLREFGCAYRRTLLDLAKDALSGGDAGLFETEMRAYLERATPRANDEATGELVEVIVSLANGEEEASRERWFELASRLASGSAEQQRMLYIQWNLAIGNRIGSLIAHAGEAREGRE